MITQDERADLTRSRRTAGRMFRVGPILLDVLEQLAKLRGVDADELHAEALRHGLATLQVGVALIDPVDDGEEETRTDAPE